MRSETNSIHDKTNNETSIGLRTSQKRTRTPRSVFANQLVLQHRVFSVGNQDESNVSRKWLHVLSLRHVSILYMEKTYIKSKRQTIISRFQMVAVGVVFNSIEWMGSSRQEEEYFRRTKFPCQLTRYFSSLILWFLTRKKTPSYRVTRDQFLNGSFYLSLSLSYFEMQNLKLRHSIQLEVFELFKELFSSSHKIKFMQ